MVQLGMATVNHVNDHKEFPCAACGEPLSVEAPRAIIDLHWDATPLTDDDSGTAGAVLQ